jgi:hypothetical protein
MESGDGLKERNSSKYCNPFLEIKGVAAVF